MRFEPPPGDQMLQSYAIEEFHGDEGAALVFANIVNGADVGMVESGGSLRLSLKSGEGLGIARYLLRKELQGNKTSQACVFRFVNHAHPAPAEFFDHAVVRDELSDH